MRSVLCRSLGVLSLSAAVGGLVPAVAMAQPTEPAPAPPVANCGFLSAVVCQVPVSILVPVNVDSIFPPQPTS